MLKFPFVLALKAERDENFRVNTSLVTDLNNPAFYHQSSRQLAGAVSPLSGIL